MTEVVDINMQSKIAVLKGVGPKKSDYLRKLNINTVEDFLYFYPKDYEDRRNLRNINSLRGGNTALIKGRLTSMLKGRITRRQTLKLLIQDNTGAIEVIFFNGGYIAKSLKLNEEYLFYGKVNINNGKLQMLHPDFTKYDSDEKLSILPVYPLTSGIVQGDMRKWQREAHDTYLPHMEEYLPEATIARNRLCGIHHAIENIHFPKDRRTILQAKYRLIFEELLFLQTGLLSIKKKITSIGKGISFSEEATMDGFISTLPYTLTDAQQRVLKEINHDMVSGKVMNRLVQGDVGSGKTILAAAAMYKAVKCGYQAIMMAPTELLAKQHFEDLKSLFIKHDIAMGFLSGSISAKDKTETLCKIESGEIDIIIGTHAVIQPNVKYASVGLVITDEQHRFGVNQREILTKKGINPDVLVMTATPIPRTLAFILYGDMDISIIDQMPPGRQPVITRAVKEDGREAAYEFVRREVKKGRQAYVVAPLIEDSEHIDAKSALGLYDELKERFNEFPVAFLHGAMKQADKDRVMNDLYTGKIQILISTVVIEVGINVPNATIMLIENAERFGLAQLHQLRGRVGRGNEQSYCILITEKGSPISEERAEIMRTTNDGFLIAEKDLELRGPGEFFGIRQHGIPELKIADIAKHMKILNTVREEADLILEEDGLLIKEENKRFKSRIDKLFNITGNLNL